MTRTAMSGGPKRLADCLPARWRSALSTRIDESFRLRQVWHAHVPEPLASHACPVRYAAGLLFIHADTAAWASRLRHEQPALIALLKTDPMFRDLANVRIRVVPRQPPVPENRRRPATRLTPRAAKLIRQGAASISDPRLRAALERLSRPADVPRHNKPRS